MHIKQVIIQGFKSYKDQAITEEFSPRLNCIVGRNGSGKSNFFDALRFVLADIETPLRQEERQAMLHEGAGNAVMSAFVEIVFDNSDNRLPIDKHEVRIRRTIGLKKDEYFVDTKHYTKAEVVNLLESAGFSRSNPYYIVQQGKVNALTMMHDRDRLELLKEVAGTRVYDQRRSESVKLLEEDELRRHEIGESLQYIEERLGELQAEKEELDQYLQLDRDRRALEYTFYERELSTARERLDKIDTDRREDSDRAGTMHRDAMRIYHETKRTESEARDLEAEIAALRSQRDQWHEDTQTEIRRRTQLDLDVKELRDRVEVDRASGERVGTELQRVEAEIAERRAELEAIGPRFEAAAGEESQMKERLAIADRRIQALYSKQTRGRQFGSVKERDAWIQRELASLTQQHDAKTRQLAVLDEEINAAEADMADCTQRLTENKSGLTERRALCDRLAPEMEDARRRRDEMIARRKEHWRHEAELDTAIEQAEHEQQKATKTLHTTIAKTLSAGLQGVRRIAQEQDIRGVYGPLIELLTTEEKFATAVEVTAGNSLFHVVVDTDETASRLLEALQTENVGRITFMPLNRLRAKAPAFDAERYKEDAVPMVDRIKFQPMFRPAMLQVFGRTLIARDIDVATQLSRELGFNCVTMAGDQVNRRGALTGGYHDQRRSRILTMQQIQLLKRRLDRARKESEKVKAQITDADVEVTRLMSEHQRMEARREEHRTAMEQMNLEIRQLGRQHDDARRLIEDKTAAASHLRDSIREVTLQTESLRAELGTALTERLSAEERTELSGLQEEMPQRRDEVIHASTERAQLEARRSALSAHLQTNLEVRLTELQQEQVASASAERVARLAGLERELQEAQENVRRASERVRELTDDADSRGKRLARLKQQLDELKAKGVQHQKDLSNESEHYERLLNERTVLLQRKEEYMRKIRDLGSLPAQAHEAYGAWALKRIIRELNRIHQELRKYDHVNKKALDQYVTFTNQREELVQRKEELGQEVTAIRDLIRVLDERKEEAIQRTYKQVGKNFAHIFEKLVPGGRGRFVKVRPRPGTEGEEEDNGNREGISIRVSFTGGELVDLGQLSGGQKAITALALIFAIQQTDPAPFYLFDEIDAALDPAHRTAVASLVQENSASNQFVVSTFRPELVMVSDKYYAIQHRNKVSRIVTTDHQHAIEFIEQEASG
eukprot:gnl/Trimastix_PCT/2064.p1 GENE.gnl/Trimastix_PCT/2064~~gnl/Trimastix_PCT/2064.p1  ORF type:complete len:1189 (+),score=483.16 gnl/Trimastix_PCT/2064:114-3680(+)